jgi:two-component system CheB/CheR fusion protein
MLIKVSSFFRDEEMWEALRAKILPQLIAGKRHGDELRVWCAGCATGEEAYSVAISIAEVLGPAWATQPVKVFGTDADASAIATARRGIYAPQSLENVSPELLQRWFSSAADGMAVKKEIRRNLVFGVNDLVSDAPISRLDLLLCRNVFIYLDTSLQRRVLTRFHYSLRPEGVLVVGKSELIPFAAKIFHPVDLSRRIYRKERREDLSLAAHERLLGLLARSSEDREDPAEATDGALAALGDFTRDAFNSITLPLIATALDGTIAMWNRSAARLWGRTELDVVGKKLVALGLPGLGGDLLVDKSALVREGKAESQMSDGVIARGQGVGDLAISVQVTPMRGRGDETYGLLYTVQDLTSTYALQSELRKAHEDRQSATEELQTINEELQSANEELETTNEELQSANEELQTTNEELESANEELETTNEELQSTNAELDATNRELAHRTEELNVLTFYHRTIVRSLSAAVVVLNPDGRVTIWNLAAERLLGLPESEAVGQLVWSLRIPALRRSLLLRIRKGLGQRLATRIDAVAYELPSGGRGIGSLAAIPISEGEQMLGAVLIFEDATRRIKLAKELRELKTQTNARATREKRERATHVRRTRR